MPYLSALEVRSRRGAIQIHVYLYLYLYLNNVNLFKNEIRSESVSQAKSDIFNAIILRCSTRNLLTSIILSAYLTKFGLAATLIFDLLSSKSNKFRSVLNCTEGANLVKFPQAVCKIPHDEGRSKCS